MPINVSDQLWLMEEALKEAEIAYREAEVPIGAIIVDSKGTIIAKAHNEKETAHNPCGHAEILAIKKAAKQLNNWRLLETSLIVTLEPCPMCLAAMVQARISHLYFGAYDSKGGAISLNYNLHKDTRLNHQFQVTGGIRHFECSRLLSNFFKERRSNYSKN